jgi:2-hydroxymuconate-semialdehyde hydrolase
LGGFPELESHRITAGGIPTGYFDEGTGDPVVLVHGSGAGVSALANWYTNIPALSQTHRVLAPDLAGFGDSDLDPDRGYGIDLWVEHLVGFLDALELERAHFVGNSLGGWVSAELARAHPDRVGRMVLMGTGGTPGSSTPRLRQHQQYEPSLENMRAVLEGFVWDTSLITDDFVEYRFDMSRRAGAPEAFKATVAGRNRDREAQPLNADRVANVAHETLLVHGKDDHVIPVEASWALLSALPNAHLVVFAHCGHWAQIEHARRFNMLVADFFEHGLD